MQINQLYNLSISVEDDNVIVNTFDPPSLIYNVANTYPTQPITVIINAKDFNGNNINKTVRLSCDKGYFITDMNQRINEQYIGTDVINVTIENGVATVPYMPTESGTVTIQCGESQNITQADCQLQVQEYILKAINTTQGESPRYLTIYPQKRCCTFSYYFQSQVISQTNTSIKIENEVIPQQYRPKANVRVSHYRPDMVFIVGTDGSVYVRTSTNNANPISEYVRFDWTY